MRLLDQGAEAKVYATSIKGMACIVKDRIEKKYRIKEIDRKLRLLRTRHEASLLARAARAGVNVPKVIDVSALSDSSTLKAKGVSSPEFLLCIEMISGSKMRDFLIRYAGEPERVKEICWRIGEQVRKMHNADIIHGDLTTSNMIYDGNRIYFIDFGLGEVSTRLEDKAVDLHLIKECFKSKHYDIWKEAWEAFKEGYGKSVVFEQLRKVEARARYKK